MQTIQTNPLVRNDNLVDKNLWCFPYFPRSIFLILDFLSQTKANTTMQVHSDDSFSIYFQETLITIENFLTVVSINVPQIRTG